MLDDLLLFPTVIPMILLSISTVLMLISAFVPIEHAILHDVDSGLHGDVGHDSHNVDTHSSGIMSFLGFKDRVPMVLALFIVSAIMCSICYFITPYLNNFSTIISITLGITLLILSFIVSCRITAVLMKPLAIFIRNNSGIPVEIIGSVGIVKVIMSKKSYVVLKVVQGGLDTELNVYLDDVSNIEKGDKVIITGKKTIEVTLTEVYIGEKVQD